jgi:hypothetical protein
VYAVARLGYRIIVVATVISWLALLLAAPFFVLAWAHLFVGDQRAGWWLIVVLGSTAVAAAGTLVVLLRESIRRE